MKIIKGLEQIHSIGDCAVTMGTFDGVHRGHHMLIERLIEEARKRGLKSILLTFDPHPRLFFGGAEKVKLLTTLDEKLDLLKMFDLDCVGVLEFNQALAAMSYQAFVDEILLNKLRMRLLVVGYDHGFGKGREGTFENLKRLGRQLHFDVLKVEPLVSGEHIVKSSTIRRLLLEGDVSKAAELLGHLYELKGKVVKGRLVGKKLEFPTANLYINDSAKLLPKDGVYAVDVKVNDRMYRGMLNIGFRPTVNHSTQRTVEVHIHDFSQDIYGKEITVFFKKRLRDERKFESLEELKKQLLIDREQSLKI